MVFAAYGIEGNFLDVTNQVKDGIRNPDGLNWNNPDIMGGDPHPGWDKVLVILYDDDSGRNFCALLSSAEPAVSKAKILELRLSK